MSRAPLKPVVPSGVNQSGNSLRGSFGAAIHTADGRRRLKEESGNNEKIITTATTADLPSYVPTCLDELLERSTTQPPPSHYPQHYIQPHHQPQQLTDSSIQEGFGVGEGSLGLDASGGEDVVDNLQQEISLLQHALINRFRGSHKTVGGSQFRVGGSKQFTNGKCEMCDSREKTLAKAKEMIKKLKQNQESALLGRSQTSSGVNRQQSMDNNNTVGFAAFMEERNQLHSQIRALQDEIDLLRRQAELHSSSDDAASHRSAVHNEVATLRLQVEQLTTQNEKLVQLVADVSRDKLTAEQNENIARFVCISIHNCYSESFFLMKCIFIHINVLVCISKVDINKY